MARLNYPHCTGYTRRDLLHVGAAAGFLGLTLPQLLHLEARAQAAGHANPPRRAQSVIMLWLSGGPSHIDIWDLKPEAPENIRGEFQPMDTSAPGIRISEHLP